LASIVFNLRNLRNLWIVSLVLFFCPQCLCFDVFTVRNVYEPMGIVKLTIGDQGLTPPDWVTHLAAK
jgi:hypothetical protein